MSSIQRDGRAITQKQAVQDCPYILAYHTLLKPCHQYQIQLCHQIQPFDQVSKSCASSSSLHSIWIRYASKVLAIIEPSNLQNPGGEDVQRVAHTRYAVLDRKPTIVHLTFLFATSLKPASKYQHRCGWDSQIPFSDQPR
jgi:hypothetical protein